MCDEDSKTRSQWHISSVSCYDFAITELRIRTNASNQYEIFNFQGQLYVNSFNLGRYWPDAGPQETLCVPAPLLFVGQ